MDKTAIILHGTKGSPEGNWFPWLKAELIAKGYKVYVPELPTRENQTKEAWCAALREQCPAFDENTTLIGHSCGATFILHILEVCQPVERSILVSPVLDDIGISEYDDLNHTFVHHGFDWQKIQKAMGKARILHGDNDPYVSATHPQAIADNLHLDVEWIAGGGHLNAETGYTQFPRLMEITNG
jgi:hypothetical protein